MEPDIVIFDDAVEWTIGEEDLRFRNKLSPYVGLAARGRVRETWLRGELVFSDDAFYGSPRGIEQIYA